MTRWYGPTWAGYIGVKYVRFFGVGITTVNDISRWYGKRLIRIMPILVGTWKRLMAPQGETLCTCFLPVLPVYVGRERYLVHGVVALARFRTCNRATAWRAAERTDILSYCLTDISCCEQSPRTAVTIFKNESCSKIDRKWNVFQLL